MPQVIELVKQVETFFPMPNSGKDKLEMVRTLLQKAYEAAGNATATFDILWPVISAFVSSMVTLYNNLGIFKSK